VSAAGAAPAAPAAPIRRRVSSRERRLAELGVLATVVMWSANFVVVKVAVEAIGPLTFTALRYVVASLTLFLLVAWRLGAVRPPARTALTLMGLGALGFGCYQVLWSVGLTQITAGDSALIIAVSPVLTAVLAGAVGMDRLTAPKLLGALVAFAGVGLVIAGGQELALGASLAGSLLTLGAAVLWAVYTVGGTRMLRSVDPLQATAWAVLGGTVVLVPFGLWEAGAHGGWGGSGAGPSPGVALAILYSGALAAGIANVFVFNAIRLVGPTRVTVSQFLVPFGAVLLGALALDEPVGAAQLAGGVVIVLGVALTRRASVLPAALRGRPAAR
jgi:drug/metabolite transporter (DMT)-like permease